MLKMHAGTQLPISVLLAAKNEAVNLPRCLAALGSAQRVVVLDSDSTDAPAEIVEADGAELVQSAYRRDYPRKRQWGLETLAIETPGCRCCTRTSVVPGADSELGLQPRPVRRSASPFWLCTGDTVITGVRCLAARLPRAALERRRDQWGGGTCMIAAQAAKLSMTPSLVYAGGYADRPPDLSLPAHRPGGLPGAHRWPATRRRLPLLLADDQGSGAAPRRTGRAGRPRRAGLRGRIPGATCGQGAVQSQHQDRPLRRATPRARSAGDRSLSARGRRAGPTALGACAGLADPNAFAARPRRRSGPC